MRRRSAIRKFRLRTRSQVIDPLVVVSDGNGQATDHPSVRRIVRSFTRHYLDCYVRARRHVLAIYRLLHELRLSESRGKYASFAEKSRRKRASANAMHMYVFVAECDRNSTIWQTGFPLFFFFSFWHMSVAFKFSFSFFFFFIRAFFIYLNDLKFRNTWWNETKIFEGARGKSFANLFVNLVCNCSYL